MQFACKLGTDIPFRGRDALLRLRDAGVSRCIAVLTIDAPDAMLWGGEAILRDGRPAGFVTSAAFGHTLGKPVALGIVEHHVPTRARADIVGGRFEVDLAGVRLPATAGLRAPYDPKNLRIR